MARRICDNKCINSFDKTVLLNSVNMSIDFVNDQLKKSIGKEVRNILIEDLRNLIQTRDNLNITSECK